MNLEPLIPPDLAELVARGEARQIAADLQARRWRQPRTRKQIFDDAEAAMDEEDRQAAMAADPLLWARLHRPRRLIDVILGRN